MKKLVVNKTVLIFLNINDFESYSNRGLLEFKNEYLKKYDNCLIYNYFDLKNHKSIIKDKIDKLKFQNQKKINARDCKIINVDSKIKTEFLNKNHIQDSDKSQILLGAYHQDELIAVMTFDKVSGMNGGLNTGEFTLSRFAVKTGVIVVGIFNKILKTFINNYTPKKIISFGDLNFLLRENNIYINNNFKLSRVNKPDYKHYHKKNDKLYHKFTYGNKYMKNPNISDIEKEKTKNELIRVWNCGKIKYELIIDENNVPVFGFVYMILNKTNNKKYIGQTVRLLEKRIYEYKSSFNTGNHNNSYLYNSFKKHGWDNFEFSIIDTAQTIEELNSKEIRYIIQYKTTDKKFGYNIESGGNNAIPTIETIEKMSRSHKGIIQTDTWVNKRIAEAGSEEALKYGKPRTEEEKQYLSENSPKYWQGKTRDKETCDKISITKLRNGPSQKLKDAIFKTVYKISILDNKITSYESTGEAGKVEGVNQSTVSRWCQKNTNKNGFLWTYTKPI